MRDRKIELWVWGVLCLLIGMTAQGAEKVIQKTANGNWEIQTRSTVFPIAPATELPVRGAFMNRTAALEVVYADGTRDCALKAVDGKVEEKDGLPVLRLDYQDAEYGLEASVFTRAFPELDVLEKWVVLKNTSKDTIRVENAQSGCVTLPKDEYDLIHYGGEWAHEFMPQRGRLTPGVKTIQVRDFVAFNSAPWFAIVPANGGSETEGPVWFGGVHYSGNWRLDFDKLFKGGVQITGGLNFWDSHWTLKAGESFETPKMVIGFSNDGLTGASQRMHRYICERLLPAKFRDRPRPVLYNSWYATGFDVNEKHQLALASVAKEIGVEMFVIDDGWFKGRVDDHGGLGDWTVDKNKFPNGLKPMIDKINAMGLDFGIWVEPEMVNPNSDLYRAHPDWVFHYPKRERHEWRNQLMLNLAREDVYNYLLDSMTNLLKENNIKFIKWDRNRPLTEPGWPDAPAEMQREARIRYTHNLYRLIETLRERFPDVWFESCSGGGGRPDMGMLSRMDQTWVSDDTDPLNRIQIQYGYLHAFPARTMVSWITQEDWGGVNPSLDFRFQVAMAGVLGIGFDITKWTPEERKTAARFIAQYKKIRPVVQMGDAYRLISPFENHRSATQYVAKNRSESVVFLYNLWWPLEGGPESARVTDRLRLRGLDPDAKYQLSGARSGGVFTGRQLMDQGVEWPVNGAHQGAILQIRQGEPAMQGARILRTDSEASGTEAANVLDGNPSSFWHTFYGANEPKYPHFIEVDLGKERVVDTVRLLPRQEGPQINGVFKDVKIWLGNDPKDWGKPAIETALDESLDWKELKLPEKKKARYLRLEALSPQDPKQVWASLAELEVTGPKP